MIHVIITNLKKKMIRDKTLKEIEIPKDLAEFLFCKVHPLLKEYHLQQQISTNTIYEYPTKKKYDLKWLVISCYLQGMSDAQQVLTKVLIGEKKNLNKKSQSKK